LIENFEPSFDRIFQNIAVLLEITGMPRLSSSL